MTQTPTPAALAIPHTGSKPAWLEDDIRVLYSGGVGKIFRRARNLFWNGNGDYILPADHWAAPVLTLRQSSGENWTPWNPRPHIPHQGQIP